MIDINKKIQMCSLYDAYGNLLTEKQKQIFTMYYYDDLSLFEIAEELKITRQGVRDSLVKSAEQLQAYEEKCGLAQKIATTKEQLDDIQQSLNTTDMAQAKISQKLHKIITEL